ncbi:MAG: SH3 domain-containing protein [Gammaproteobacteria bacterium]|nr:SH3 domain-containing protein [Gammaproteobacteria bacterium]
MLRNAKLFSVTLGLISGFSMLNALAANVDLYDQPDVHSKVIGKIDTDKGFVPIFSSKSNDWVKVGDPMNGNTGWVKSADLAKAANSPQGYSISQTMVNNGQYPQWVVRFSTPKTMTSEQTEAFWKKFQAQQMALQQDMQKMMNDFYTNVDNAHWNNFPMIMPVVMVPVQNAPAGKDNTKQKK